MGDDLDNLLRTIDVPAEVTIRNASKRELEMRLLPWGQVIETQDGFEEFTRGAFDGTVPEKLRLRPPEHEVRIGLGQDGKATMILPTTGKGISYEDREDGPVVVYRVARTQAGDEQLALAEDGITTGVSIEFVPLPGGHVISRMNGRRKVTHHRAELRGATTTNRPAYGEQATVLAVRSEQEEPNVAEATAPEQAPAFDTAPIVAAIREGIDTAMADVQARGSQNVDAINSVIERLDKMDEQARANFAIPAMTDKPDSDKFGKGEWASVVLRMLTGEKIDKRELEARVAAELITTDNLGVVPEQFLSEMKGIIDPARPFLDSTRQLQTPASGMTFTIPVITTRPTVGVQAAEKDELASTTTSITDENFTPITIGGYGDISLQLLRRSDPSYLDLYIELLAEAYAVMADDKAVDALLAASGLNNGGNVNAEDGPLFGSAWANAAAVSRRLVPDTIWLSSSAVAAFIDAKSDTTNAPLYGNLAGAFSAAGGTGGTISGLRPVHVPALDDEAADAIVGPSRGFAWAEDGTFTLQVDVPAKAGRDVALVGLIWFMPIYPAAFTRYTVGS